MSELISRIRDAVIGAGSPMQTPFGCKPLVYADYTASGRSLEFIEDYIHSAVLPAYANTHTETSYTGAATTALREQARELIRRAVNGGDQDKVVFCGSGATAAINKLLDVMNLRLPAELDARYNLASAIPADQRPVVFIGPYEHHANELPWRESLCDVVVIPIDADGCIDKVELARQLTLHAGRSLKIGSFSAASNVTGILSDVPGVTRLLREHGALAFWDYAAAGPYVQIDMNAESALDAVFLSPHKFVGGPGTPGVLVAKQALFTNRVPAMVGGGTVSYVTPESHSYLADIERREEGGTPAIVESIRAGLVFKLQQEVGTDTIHALEQAMVGKALQRFARRPEIEVLGASGAQRLSILALRFRHRGQELHYGFVTALLNDVFGIQARGGCSCAGPYGHHLLGLDKAASDAIGERIAAGETVLRPGWVRLNLNYFIADEELEYLLRALELVAEHGWRLLPYYGLDSKGNWRWQGRDAVAGNGLGDWSWQEYRPAVPAAPRRWDWQAELNTAAEQLCAVPAAAQPMVLRLSAAAEAVRWFMLPQEVAAGPAVVAAAG